MPENPTETTTASMQAERHEEYIHGNGGGCCGSKSKPHHGKMTCMRTMFVIILLLQIGTLGGLYVMSAALGINAVSDIFDSTSSSGTTLEDRVVDRMLALEYAKVGGKDTYDLLNEAQRIQIEDQLPQIRQYLDSMKTNKGKPKSAVSANGQPTATITKLTDGELAKIREGAYLSGKTNARLLVIEYSDLECPYCIHHHKIGTVEKLLQQYPDAVYTFKSDRGANHAGTETKGRALLCAGQLGEKDAYYRFIDAVFGGSNDPLVGEGQSVYDVTKIPALVKSLAIKVKDFDDCTKSDTIRARFEAETQEGTRLGITGTPGTVIIDTKTLKYIAINGARDISLFTSEIDRLLADGSGTTVQTGATSTDEMPLGLPNEGE